MRVIRPALALLAAAFIPACHDDDPATPTPLTFLPTTTHFQTGSSDMTGETLFIVSSADVEYFESQSGITQTAGMGLFLGRVRDSSGTALSGVQISPISDANTVVGTVVYRNASGFWSSAATSTNGLGDFIVFNVPPGRINLRATAGASGNAYVTSVADEAAVVFVTAEPGFSAITWTGFTRGLTNVAGAPVGAVTITGPGTGAGVFPAASGGGGDFTATTPPAHNTYLVQLTGGGFVTTLNVVTVGSGALASPAGDLFGVTPATRTAVTFTPASMLPLDVTKGIIRGVLAPTSGTADGYTVTARKADGTVVGGVRYGGTAAPVGAPDDTLTASSTNGIFYIYNVDAGDILITASKSGFAGGTTVPVIADGITIVTVAPESVGGGTETILLAGFLQTSTATASVGDGTLSVHGKTGTSSSDFLGTFVITSVPSNHRLRVRATKP